MGKFATYDAAATLDGSELVLLKQGSDTVKTTTGDIAALAGGVIIDDGAGNGDTDKVWSADKVFDYIASLLAGVIKHAGGLDCSANPNYPAAVNGAAYVVTVAGKIGGGSGEDVQVGDLIICSADNAGGTEASVGTSWYVLEHNIPAISLTGYLEATNDLSDVDDVSNARDNLDVYSTGEVDALIAGAGGYTAEQARDDVGAALVAGAGITITPDDGGDTITVELDGPSIQSVSSAATVTPTFADDLVIITAQAAALALANPTGSSVDGRGMAIRIKDNGTARAISFDTQYRAIGVTLPTTTVISKTLYLGLVFNNADTKWDVVAVAQES